jgi:hypothetical protein
VSIDRILFEASTHLGNQLQVISDMPPDEPANFMPNPMFAIQIRDARRL